MTTIHKKTHQLRPKCVCVFHRDMLERVLVKRLRDSDSDDSEREEESSSSQAEKPIADKPTDVLTTAKSADTPVRTRDPSHAAVCQERSLFSEGRFQISVTVCIFQVKKSSRFLELIKPLDVPSGSCKIYNGDYGQKSIKI